jgi:KipI family sensor histidine kinase inhibitor
VSPRLRLYGPQAWLVEHPDPAGLAAVIRDRAPGDLVEVVPGANTTLVVAADGTDRAAVEAWLAVVAESEHDNADPAAGGLVEIPVVYDGDDLAGVATATGLTVAEVVDRHISSTYRCAFCGFAPGFGYLTGLDPSLHLPRRATPRPRVPAGSVAIAAAYSAVYPTASPGGWHLLGRTEVELWRTDRDPPAMITPGAFVRFVPARP